MSILFGATLLLQTTGYDTSVQQTNQLLETARLDLPTTIRGDSPFKLKLDPLLQADPLNNSPSERYWVDLPEGYLQWQRSGWQVQAGYDTFTWGVTDGFNPLDAVSTRRFQDALSPDKLGAPSLSIKKSIGSFTLEGIYIPWQRPGILPGENSRWLPREILTSRSFEIGTEPVTIQLPSNPRYSYAPSEELDHALENNLGFRVQAQSLLPDLDLSLEAYEGAAPTPAVDLRLNGTVTDISSGIVIQADPGIQLTPVMYRQLVYGTTLVYAGFGMIFRFEAAITRLISKRDDLPGNAEQEVLGLERTLSLGSQSLTLLAQLTYGQHAVPVDNSTASIDRIFDRALILGARYSFSERLGATASGLYDTEFHSALAQLEIAYSLTEALKLKLGAMDLWGSPESPLGAYAQNGRAQLSVVLSL